MNASRSPAVYVKFCGLTRSRDVETALSLGVDAIGLVFYPKSGRHVSEEHARALARLIPAGVDCVALFVNPERAQVLRVIDRVRPTVLQFHGDESAEFCNSFGCPYWKAIGMSRKVAGGWLAAEYARYSGAAAVLLDGHAPGHVGGAGQSFDWRRVRQPKQRLILAGGLTADTVADAIRKAHPWGVDVSSGIEKQAGIKDAARMRAFMDAVGSAG